MICRSCEQEHETARMRIIPYDDFVHTPEEDTMGPYCDKCWSRQHLEAAIFVSGFVFTAMAVAILIQWIFE